MDARGRLRLIQYGIPVAWAEGSGAFSEMNHYAFVYGQDGPVTIEFHDGKRWKRMLTSRRALATGSGTAETGETPAQCEASQSGPKGNARKDSE